MAQGKVFFATQNGRVVALNATSGMPVWDQAFVDIRAGESATASALPGGSAVRGTVASVRDSVLTVSSTDGDRTVILTQPVTIYERRPADLAKVTDHSFVGVTSVKQPDGSERATEIHIFPEELRGTGEGSYMMQAPGGGESQNRMTNGNVSSSRMTNGSVEGSRMTNGTVGGASGGTLTVQYQGGAQTITVPAGVSVTEIVRTDTTLAPGERVIVLATEASDGTLHASRGMLAGTDTTRR